MNQPFWSLQFCCTGAGSHVGWLVGLGIQVFKWEGGPMIWQKNRGPACTPRTGAWFMILFPSALQNPCQATSLKDLSVVERHVEEGGEDGRCFSPPVTLSWRLFVLWSISSLLQVGGKMTKGIEDVQNEKMGMMGETHTRRQSRIWSKHTADQHTH